jgi:hypothetical protein
MVRGRVPATRCRPFSHDEARQGTPSPYLNNHGPQVRVGGKPAHPHRLPWRLSSEAKPAPQGSDLGNLLKYHPPHHHEDSRTGPNTMEASNRLWRIDHLKSRPTSHVHHIENIEIISLYLSSRLPAIKGLLPFQQGDTRTFPPFSLANFVSP